MTTSRARSIWACRWWRSASSTASRISASASAATAGNAEYVRSPAELLPAEPALTPAIRRSSSRSAVARDAARAGVEIDVGRNKLFLLDTDVDGNSEENRQLAARLYFGDQRIRIRQELLLGVGAYARCAPPASTGAGCT